MVRLVLGAQVGALCSLAAPVAASAHPARIDASELAAAWDPALPVFASAAVAAVLFARGFFRLRVPAQIEIPARKWRVSMEPPG
jgi:hypothetical protein